MNREDKIKTLQELMRGSVSPRDIARPNPVILYKKGDKTEFQANDKRVVFYIPDNGRRKSTHKHI